jgi:ATP-dependent RNA helicase DeaD
MSGRLFSELNLSPEILKAIERLGFEKASLIQSETIPVLMEGRDVVGQSQTGSGKTAAFSIPALERLDTTDRKVQVLILCPTRELAVQVSEEVHKLAFFKRGVHPLPIYGGQSYERQLYGLKQGAQIIIGTPGRVMDHMRRGTLKLESVKMVVLDEADVMLDMGFRDDIEFILQATPQERQTVFFSATMPKQIQELIKKYARDPQYIRIEQKSLTVPTVEQVYYEVDRRFKVELLTRLIDLHDLKLGIIFCNTKRMVDDLVDHLNAQGYSADRLHGDMSQAMRDRVMNKFRQSGLEFLVATDVAARGIDVDDVQVVFNYDLPYDVEDYVHRIGRTGRAGRSGRAISFVAGRELFQIQLIERYTRMRIQRAKVPTLTEVEAARVNSFLGKIRQTLQSGDYQKQDQVVEVLLEEGFTSTDIASALIHHLQHDQTRSSGERNAATPLGRGGADRNPDERRQSRESRDRREPLPPREPRERRPAREFTTEENAPARPERVAQRAPAPKREPQPSVAPTEQPSELKAQDSHARTEPKLVETKAVKSPEPSEPQGSTHSAPTRSESKPTETARAKAPWLDKPKRVAEKPVEPPKASRRTPPGQTRIHLNIGSEFGFNPNSILRIIQGETGVPAKSIGYVDLRERHAFVDVDSAEAKSVVSKLNRSQANGRKIKAKMRES